MAPIPATHSVLLSKNDNIVLPDLTTHLNVTLDLTIPGSHLSSTQTALGHSLLQYKTDVLSNRSITVCVFRISYMCSAFKSYLFLQWHERDKSLKRKSNLNRTYYNELTENCKNKYYIYSFFRPFINNISSIKREYVLSPKKQMLHDRFVLGRYI